MLFKLFYKLSAALAQDQLRLWVWGIYLNPQIDRLPGFLLLAMLQFA